VCHAHPVEGAIGRTLRSIEVVVAIDIEQAGRRGPEPAQTCHHAQRDRAVPTQDQRCVPRLENWGDALGQRLEPGDDLLEVLGTAIAAVGAPELLRQVTMVIDTESFSVQRVDEPGGPECGWSLVLTGGIAAGAAGKADDGKARHGTMLGAGCFGSAGDQWLA
jgi:hypothetical protein